MSKLQEIIAIPLSQAFRRDAFAIHRAKRGEGASSDQPVTFSLKGESDPDEFKPGLSYRFFGTWEKANQHGVAFNFNSFAVCQPHGKTGIISYLKQCRHVGEATAYALWEAFKGDAVRILREDPGRAAAAVGPRFKAEKALEASEDLQEMKAAEGVTIALHDLLDGRGFGKGAVRTYIKAFGAKAVEILRRDPYKAQIARGVGWKKADAFYLDVGGMHAEVEGQAAAEQAKKKAREDGCPEYKIDEIGQVAYIGRKNEFHNRWNSKLKRQAYSIAYAGLKEAEQEGHVWVPLESAINGLKASIGGATVTPEKALSLATRGKVVVTRKDDRGATWIADIRRARAEQYVAEKIVDAMYASQIGPPMPEWEQHVEYVTVKPDHTKCTRCNRTLTAREVWIFGGKPFGPDCIQKVDGTGEALQIPLDTWLNDQATVETIITQQLAGATRLISAVEWPAVNHPAFGAIADKTPTAHQLEEYQKATSGPIGILSGRPGTGKSFLLVRLVKALIALHGSQNIDVMAPTGKAAQRVKEIMQEAGVQGVTPTTIHRGLGVASSSDGWSFIHDERNPLTCKFLIIEEASMLGLGLFRSVLAALAKGTGLLLVGDVNQLPPVEFGAPLRDMIAAGLPYGEFVQIHRNSGLIVKTCSAIVDGKPWEPAEKIDLKAEDPINLCLVTASKHRAPDKVLQLVQQLKEHSPWDAVADVQVVVAVNKRSPMSRVALNQRLQSLLNSGISVPGCPFKLSDKVICLKNSFLASAGYDSDTNKWSSDNEIKHLISNGEIGRVEWLADTGKQIVVKFPSPERFVMVFRGNAKAGDDGSENGDEEKVDTGCDLDLAYAVTVHRSQGSQWPIIIYCLDEYPGASGQFGIVDRSHIYTGISRAQKACFLIGMKHVADSVCSRSFISRRKTFLVELIKEYATKAGVELRCSREPGGPSLESLFAGKKELQTVSVVEDGGW